MELQTPNYGAMKVEQYFPFFMKLDVMFPSRDSVCGHALLKEFGANGLRVFTTPYDYMASLGLFTPLTRDEIRAAAEKRRQNMYVAQACGKWFEKEMIAFQEHLETIAKRYADRGWKGKKARFRPRTISSALQVAIRFYNHIDACGIINNRQIHQDIVDGFIFHNPGYKQPLRTLVSYFNRHGKVFRKLKIEPVNLNIPKDALLPPDKCNELIKNWLCSEGKESKKGLIGILMLMYAQQPSKLVRLRMSEIQRNEKGIYSVAFGTTELELEPEISALFDRYLEHRHALSMMEDDLHNEWLFPGRKFGCHMTSSAVSCVLKDMGVTADQLFATSIYNAYQSGMRHSKVLVNAYGISPLTAIKYLKLLDPRMYDEADSTNQSQHATG
ncbi:hypothetical protein MMIC_P1321 [Mariprofundus micogutta]|uniref:Uncharacterized protein n=1 Tax=Mariprofundus micogutta TaxID=1921010 RepID=A0A1L8CN68_9PROT|nr:hypothetical protein [Mariprofundus micogutta]GAV20356.1 hypothetical protein MMIC_P1321 [Mariprofundus micogutta]